MLDKSTPMPDQSSSFFEPKCKAIGIEVNRLLAAKFIREIKQATWVSK
jgi:hypothetical protein